MEQTFRLQRFNELSLIPYRTVIHSVSEQSEKEDIGLHLVGAPALTQNHTPSLCATQYAVDISV